MKLQWHSEHHITQQCKPELGRVSLFPQPANVFFFVCVVQTCNPGVIFNEKTESENAGDRTTIFGLQ